MKTHNDLEAARAVVKELEAKLASLSKDHAAATTELAESDAAVSRQLGASQLGEADPKALAAARQRHEQATQAVRSLAAGRELLAERLPPAQAAVASATVAFTEEAAQLLAPERERLRARLRVLAPELEAVFRDFARVDALVSRIPRGTRTGANLLRAAGLEEDALAFTMSEPPRLSEQEILDRVTGMPQAAE